MKFHLNGTYNLYETKLNSPNKFSFRSFIQNLVEIRSVLSKMTHVNGQKRRSYYAFIYALRAKNI
jgi:hypothetical protein